MSGKLNHSAALNVALMFVIVGKMRDSLRFWFQSIADIYSTILRTKFEASESGHLQDQRPLKTGVRLYGRLKMKCLHVAAAITKSPSTGGVR